VFLRNISLAFLGLKRKTSKKAAEANGKLSAQFAPCFYWFLAWITLGSEDGGYTFHQCTVTWHYRAGDYNL
jgi:hypothetical protein